MGSNSHGLSLISSYSDDDDEEDDMLNCAKTNCDKQLEGEDKKNNSSRSKSDTASQARKLPLPAMVADLFKIRPQNSVPCDNPAQHDGRTRSFPHERGNWSTFVYIPYDPEPSFTDLITLLKQCALEFSLEMRTISDSDLHISITRTVVLMHHWIDSFISSVRSKIAHIPGFYIEFGQPAVYCNDERTRTFLGLKVLSGTRQLRETTKALDLCLDEFRLPPFYEEASFHMSVLWILGDVQKALEAALPQFNEHIRAYATEHSEVLNAYVRQCCCKTGNKLYSFDFAT